MFLEVIGYERALPRQVTGIRAGQAGGRQIAQVSATTTTTTTTPTTAAEMTPIPGPSSSAVALSETPEGAIICQSVRDV